VELRSSALQSSIAQQRTQDALTALWQIAGLSQIAMRPGVELLRPPCEQIARALQLDWIVLMAPDAACPVTPVLTAYGASVEAIALHPAYLRVAAEALRSERTLVRDEGQHGYICMPILRRERAPLVIAARGAAVGGTTQTILQLLGDLLARCLDVPAAGADEMCP
jgi:hypothetical protein